MDKDVKRRIEYLQRRFSGIARETVKVHTHDERIAYAFGSEVATLRLYRHYKSQGFDCAQGHSENLGEWYFRLTTEGLRCIRKI